MDEEKTVPFQANGGPVLTLEGTIVVSYNLRTQGLNVKTTGLPNEVAVFALEAARHILLHSLKMVPVDLPVQAAPIEGEPSKQS